ncbi:hypothetical protein E2562_019923 [Oryza meyeriana var. granulata]|uniref:Uncharacterized protein n=1 Tax=Oryza meyeriana var. granulata TaxID=110450 RepID=A0A6G1EXP7_9ORYZ|nr:hypothetical protein E2562_019923 [Oryza meyeriana var. granulata]
MVWGCRVEFSRWNKHSAAEGSSMCYLVKLGLDSLPAHTWEEGMVRILMAGLHCHLLEMLPSVDGCNLEVIAWAAALDELPKEVHLAIPDSPPQWVAEEPDEDDEFAIEMANATSSQLPPNPPTEKRCLEYHIYVHLLEVVDPKPNFDGYDARWMVWDLPETKEADILSAGIHMGWPAASLVSTLP